VSDDVVVTETLTQAVARQAEEIERLYEWQRQMVELAAGGGRLDGYRELAAKLAKKDEEIDRLRQQVTQRGARMQIMREYLTQYSGGSATLWRDFCRTRPQADDWFDADGVPK
jgi:hypothetical protein